MKIEEFEQAIREDDFAVGDSFWLDDWEFQVVNRRNSDPLACWDDIVFKWELTREEFIHEIKENQPEIKDAEAFFDKHKDEILHYFNNGFDVLVGECGATYETIIKDAIDEVIRK
jgi:hypothetical protein